MEYTKNINAEISGAPEKTKDEKKDAVEIKMFTAPKKVIKKKFTDILLFQIVAAGIIIALLLILRCTLPEAFENIISLAEKYICL